MCTRLGILCVFAAVLTSCGSDSPPPPHRGKEATRVRLVEHFEGSSRALDGSQTWVDVETRFLPAEDGEESTCLAAPVPWPLARTAHVADVDLLGADDQSLRSLLDQEGVEVTWLRHRWILQAEAMERSERAAVEHAHTLASLIALGNGQSLTAPLAAPLGMGGSLVARVEAPESTAVLAVVHFNDQEIARLPVGESWGSHDIRLPATRTARPGTLRIQCVAEGPDAAQARLVAKRIHWNQGPFDVLWVETTPAVFGEVRTQLTQAGVHALYSAVSPAARTRISSDSSWDREAHVRDVLPTEAAPVYQAGTPVYLQEGAVHLQTPADAEAILAPFGADLEAGRMEWALSENGRHQTEITASGLYQVLIRPRPAVSQQGALNGQLIQPEAALRQLRQQHALTGTMAEQADGSLLRIDQGGDRRAAFLLSAPETLTFAIPEGAPDELRFAWSSLATGEGPQVRLVAVWRDAEAREVGRAAVAIATGAADSDWHAESLARPETARRLELVAEGSWYELGADATLLSTHLALTPPVLVDPAEQPGGVIVYLVDTLRADHMQVYGYGRDTTPVLADLAEQMAVFDKAYSNCSWTRPSTASLLTGLHPSFHGAHGQNVLASSVTTLAEHFHAQGYATGAIVANPNVSGPTLGFDEGFDEFRAAFEEGGGLFDIPATAFQPWIESFLNRHGNEPFLLYVHTVDPHTPYTPSEEEWRRYDPEYTGTLNGALDGEGHFEGCTDPTEEDVEHITALYDAEIRQSDRAIGDLVEVLQGRGLWDKIGLVVTSDHGEEFQEHGGWTHGLRAYEEQLHVPLLIKPAPRWGITPGRRQHRAQLSDLAPTLYRLEGLGDDPVCTGEDLTGVLQGRDGQDPGRILYFDELPALHALTFGEVKLVVYEKDGQTDRRLLFHLGEDPGEQKDRAKERLKRTDSLEGNLRQFYLPFERAGLQRIQGAGRFAVIDEATVDRLMALGYL